MLVNDTVPVVWVLGLRIGLALVTDRVVLGESSRAWRGRAGADTRYITVAWG